MTDYKENRRESSGNRRERPAGEGFHRPQHSGFNRNTGEEKTRDHRPQHSGFTRNRTEEKPRDFRPQRPLRDERKEWDERSERDDRDDREESSGEGIVNDLIEGRNAVIEALRAGRAIDKIYIAKGETDKTLGHIASKAREAGIAVVEADRRKLDFMSRTHSHQGVIAVAAVKEYCTVDDLFDIAEERGEKPFFIICDEISDSHNLGAIIRSAECAGAHGVIIPRRRSAGVTAVVDKASAGAAEHMAVARVANIPAAIDELKKRGVWVYGTAADAPADLWHTDLTGPIALVIGSEGDGMGRLVRESCDFMVSLPMKGKVTSLNASAAATVFMYEILHQRGL